MQVNWTKTVKLSMLQLWPRKLSWPPLCYAQEILQATSPTPPRCKPKLIGRISLLTQAMLNNRVNLSSTSRLRHSTSFHRRMRQRKSRSVVLWPRSTQGNAGASTRSPILCTLQGQPRQITVKTTNLRSQGMRNVFAAPTDPSLTGLIMFRNKSSLVYPSETRTDPRLRVLPQDCLRWSDRFSRQSD